MKRPLVTVAVAIEVIVCFGPAGILWVLGIMFAPTAAFADPNPDPEDFLLLGMVIGGAFGIFSVLAVLDAFVSGRPPQVSTRLIIIFAALGATSLLPVIAGSIGLPGWRLIGLLPILATVHLFYLTRTQLFRRSSSDVMLP